MNTAQKPLAIFFFESTGLIVTTSKQLAGAKFPFPAGSVDHMEIVKYDAIHDLIAQACATLELSDVPGLIVFGSSLLFEKQVGPLAADKLQAEHDAFRESTPFERVASHVYKNAQGSLLMSMNRDFYDTLRQILERIGVHVVGVVPQFVLTSLIGKAALTPKTMTLLTGKIEELATESIIIHKVMPKTLQEKQEYISKKYSGLVIVVFVLFLIAVFGGTGYILRSQFQASRATSVKITPAPVQAPIETPEATPALTPAPVASASAIKISITYVPERATQAAKLKALFQAAAYPTVKLQSQPGLQGNQPLIVFRPTTPTLYRTQIQDSVKELFSTVAIQELSELESDVSITLGK